MNHHHPKQWLISVCSLSKSLDVGMSSNDIVIVYLFLSFFYWSNNAVMVFDEKLGTIFCLKLMLQM
jgi:hypothetical protein